jgi:hypothetical protein
LTVDLRPGQPGAVRVMTSTPGDLQWVQLDLVLPSNVTIDGVELCYELANSASFISQTRLTRMTTPDGRLVIHDDTTDLLNPGPTCYFSPTAGLSVDGGIALELRLNFASDNDWIDIGSIGIHVSRIASGASDQPAEHALSLQQNYPNPFSSPTTITYSLEKDGYADVTIHDAGGRLICTLAQGHQSAGNHRVSWDGRDTNGHPVASGNYFYRIRVGDQVSSRGMLLLR